MVETNNLSDNDEIIERTLRNMKELEKKGVISDWEKEIIDKTLELYEKKRKLRRQNRD